MLCHPKKYADILGSKIKEHNAEAYLVNTGWSGGPYGVGKRISIKDTRAIIDAILNDNVEKAQCVNFAGFNFAIPTSLPGVNSIILDPRNTWEDKGKYDKAREDLLELFANNAAAGLPPS